MRLQSQWELSLVVRLSCTAPPIKRAQSRLQALIRSVQEAANGVVSREELAETLLAMLPVMGGPLSQGNLEATGLGELPGTIGARVMLLRELGRYKDAAEVLTLGGAGPASIELLEEARDGGGGEGGGGKEGAYLRLHRLILRYEVPP